MGDNRYEVYLTSLGRHEIEVIRVIRGYTDLGLKESKELAESAPVVVWSDVPEDVAQNMVRDLAAAGAAAEVRGDSGSARGTKDSGAGQKCEVFLGDMGPNKIEVIRVIREYTRLGLKEAKDLVESGPRTAASGLSEEAARKMKRDLEAAGARAEISGGGIAAWGAGQPGNEAGNRVILSDCGPNKIEVIKVIREYTGLGLKEAKDLAESAPGTAATGVDRDTAEKMKADLDRAGARAEVKSS